jgi:hypothetical protein
MRASQRPGPINGKAGRKMEANSPELFLAQFGKPARQLSCECERTSSTSLSQTFQLISGPMISRVIGQGGNVLTTLARSEGKPEAMVAELFWRTLGRAPSAVELTRMSDLIRTVRKEPRPALEDIAWSLVNAKEFVLRP